MRAALRDFCDTLAIGACWIAVICFAALAAHWIAKVI